MRFLCSPEVHLFEFFHFLTENGHITHASQCDKIERTVVLLQVNFDHLLQVVCHELHVNWQAIYCDVVRGFANEYFDLV